MKTTSILLGAATILLLGAVVLAVAFAHVAYIEACVCVVNSVSRAAVSLGVSVACAVAIAPVTDARPVLLRALFIAQAVSLVVGLFFVVQHIFFALELA